MCALSHSCCPNCRVMNSMNYKILIRSAKDIPAGEELTICYTKMFIGAISRKADLVKNWFFECQCQRCKDRLDFDSNFDCWIGQECKGSVLPQSESIRSDWQCGGCAKMYSRKIIENHEEQAQNLLDKIPHDKEMESVKLLEEFLDSHKSMLHATHFLNIQAKLKLMFAFAKAVTNCELERKVEVCSDVINMLDTIKLGYVEVRGFALYDLSMPSLVLLQGNFDMGTISRDQFKDGLNTITKNLETSIEILEVEEKGTYRKLIADRATHILNNVRELILFIDF